MGARSVHLHSAEAAGAQVQINFTCTVVVKDSRIMMTTVLVCTISATWP